MSSASSSALALFNSRSARVAIFCWSRQYREHRSRHRVRHCYLALSCLLAQLHTTRCLHYAALHLTQSPDRILQLDNRRASSKLHDATTKLTEALDSCCQTQIVANRFTFTAYLNREMAARP